MINSLSKNNFNYISFLFQVIIDTEWGGFGDHNEADYILTRYDKIVDAGSVHPGVQMLVQNY